MDITTESTSQARSKILQTALKLFYSQGIRATGVDTIIRESDVAKMTFYKHFPSKQKLVVEVLKAIETMWFDSFHKVVDRVKDPKDRLLSIFDFLSIWFKDPTFRGCAYINTTMESFDRRSEECLFAKAHKKKLSQFIYATTVGAGYSEKVSKDLAKKLLLLIDGAIVRSYMDNSVEPAKTAKAMAEVLLRTA